MSRSGRTSLFSLIRKPLLVIMLVVGVFGLVYLRSSITKLEYGLADLEKRKVAELRERKRLFAERTSLLSFAKFEGAGGDASFIVPDRVKVIRIDKQTKSLPHRASLERGSWTEPR